MHAAACALLRFHAHDEVARLCVRFETCGIRMRGAHVYAAVTATDVLGAWAVRTPAETIARIRQWCCEARKYIEDDCATLRRANDVAQAARAKWARAEYATAGRVTQDIARAFLDPVIDAAHEYINTANALLPMLIIGEYTTADADRAASDIAQKLARFGPVHDRLKSAIEACTTHDPVADFAPEWPRIDGRTRAATLEMMLCAAVADMVAPPPPYPPKGH